MPFFKKAASRWWRWLIIAAAVLTVGAISAPPATTLVRNIMHDRLINSIDYMAENGKWDIIDLGEDQAIQAIHSTVLPTGKLLLIAGSGNNRQMFEAGTFKTIVYDPVSGSVKHVDTPVDMFCGGHAHLQHGNVLVAGGTKGYERLSKNVTHAGGAMVVVNENPEKGYTIPKGSVFTSNKNGNKYRSDATIVVPPADKDEWTYEVTPVERRVFVKSEVEGAEGVIMTNHPFTVGLGLDSYEASNVHAYAPKLTMEKYEYQGIDDSFEFNPVTEEYERVGDMKFARWYPTLTTLPSGKVMAISGLDNAGTILDGEIETYDPATRSWTERPEMKRFFPTYPAIFSTLRPLQMFFAGPSTGWGPATKAREPGFWNLENNTFRPVPGIRDPDLLETGSAAWLGPVNKQRMVVVGGGGVGDSPRTTDRIDIVDLNEKNPRFTPFGKLEDPTRYPNLVPLPNGELLITHGAKRYRGVDKSDTLKAYILSENGKLRRIADPLVGRNYHSSASMLSNGQIITAGSDPLFSDPKNTKPGTFEKRLEIFTPPEFFRAQRDGLVKPAVADGPQKLRLGTTGTFTLKPKAGGTKVASVRMFVPASTTHITDTNIRAVDIPFTQDGDTFSVRLPDSTALMPKGNYMLIVNDDQGLASDSRWVMVQ